MVRRHGKMKMTGAKQVMSASRKGKKNDSFDYYVPAHVDFYGIEDFSLPSCTGTHMYHRTCTYMYFASRELY